MRLFVVKFYTVFIKRESFNMKYQVFPYNGVTVQQLIAEKLIKESNCIRQTNEKPYLFRNFPAFLLFLLPPLFPNRTIGIFDASGIFLGIRRNRGISVDIRRRGGNGNFCSSVGYNDDIILALVMII